MRLIPTIACQPGMRLGKAIYNEEGNVLLNIHVELSTHLITRLKQLGVDYVYIQDPLTDDIEIMDSLSDKTRFKALMEIRNQFRTIMEEYSNRRSINHPILGKAFNNVLKMIIEDLSENKGALIMLSQVNVMNNYLFSHTLNVTIITVTLGIIQGYSRNDLQALGLGSLLHDIGKTRINPNLLTKKGPLTIEEFEEIKQHTLYGFQLLKDEPNIPLLAAHCAFQHHERLDGSGYPRGILDEEIHDFAKWIAIADSFDAMTNHRPYRHAILPHQAMEVLFSYSGSLYDRKKVSLFRDNIAIYPLGITVRLTTGEKGVVVKIDAISPQRPVVRIFEDAEGNRVDSQYEIDLSVKHSILIESVNDFS